MSDIEITVQGNFTAYAAPERATVRLRVGHQGPEPAAVINATTAAADAVRASITQFAPRHIAVTASVDARFIAS